jgi:hypothetical protein
MRDDTLSHVSAGEFFRLRLSEMRVFTTGGWTAIGDSTDDGIAFAGAMIEGIVVTRDTIDVLPPRVKRAETLSEAVGMVLQQR